MFIQNLSEEGFGDIFIGVGQLDTSVSAIQAANPAKHNATKKWLLKPMTINYKIRVFTTGCFFFNKRNEEWTSEGLIVREQITIMYFL